MPFMNVKIIEGVFTPDTDRRRRLDNRILSSERAGIDGRRRDIGRASGLRFYTLSPPCVDIGMAQVHLSIGHGLP